MDAERLLVPEASEEGRSRGRSRAAILDMLRAADDPLGVREVARRIGLHPNTARFHLEALVEAGLAAREAEDRERPGRPRIGYRAAAVGPGGRRRYRLLALMLASLIAGTMPDPAAAAEAGGPRVGRLPRGKAAPVSAAERRGGRREADGDACASWASSRSRGRRRRRGTGALAPVPVPRGRAGSTGRDLRAAPRADARRARPDARPGHRRVGSAPFVEPGPVRRHGDGPRKLVPANREETTMNERGGVRGGRRTRCARASGLPRMRRHHQRRAPGRVPVAAQTAVPTREDAPAASPPAAGAGDAGPGRCRRQQRQRPAGAGARSGTSGRRGRR